MRWLAHFYFVIAPKICKKSHQNNKTTRTDNANRWHKRYQKLANFRRANWGADTKEGAIIADKSKSKSGRFLISLKAMKIFSSMLNFTSKLTQIVAFLSVVRTQ